MGIFEPLYYGGGRYAAITDRKLIASLIGSEIPTTDGDKVDGVIPATTNSLKVTYGSTTGAGGVTTLNVEQGWCVVTDTAYITATTSSLSMSSFVIGTDVTFTITDRQDYQVGTEVRVSHSTNSANYVDGFITEIIFTASTKTLKVKPTAVSGTGTGITSWNIRRVVQDGMYFAGLDGAGNTVTFSVPTGSTRSDSVYAVVDSTPYTITNKSSTGSSVTLTTDVPHGFRVGDTVVVSGVDEKFDGSYDITAVTTTSPHTFTYAKSFSVGGATTATSGNGTTATITTTSAHGLVAGNLVTVSGVTPNGYNGTYTLTGATSNTISFASTTTGSQTVAGTVSIATASTAVVPVAYYSFNAYTVTNKAYDSSLGEVTLTTSSSHGRIAGQYVRVEGVGREFDGTYELISGTTGSTLKYYQNRIFKTIASTAITQSSSAVARVPFRIVVDAGNAGTYATKNKILLATYTASGTTGNISSLTDARIMSIIGTNTQFIPNSTYMSSYIDNAPGRFRYHLDTNAFSYYTDQWRGFLTIGTSGATAAAGNHTHSYSAISHTHTGFSDGTLVTLPDGNQFPNHSHTVSQVTGLSGGNVIIDYIYAPNISSIGDTNTSLYTKNANNGLADGIVLLDNGSPVSVAANFTTETYVMVEASLYCTPSTYISARFSLGVTGDTTNVSPNIVDGTETHQSAATDGTAFTNRVTVSATSGTPTSDLYKLSRVFKVGSGVHAFYLHQTLSYSGPGPYFIDYKTPVLRMYPLPFDVTG